MRGWIFPDCYFAATVKNLLVPFQISLTKSYAINAVFCQDEMTIRHAPIKSGSAGVFECSDIKPFSEPSQNHFVCCAGSQKATLCEKTLLSTTF
jgi:hypothetical protein